MKAQQGQQEVKLFDGPILLVDVASMIDTLKAMRERHDDQH